MRIMNLFDARLACFASMLFILVISSQTFASELCVTNASGPDICVNKSGTSPVQGTHFQIDYSSPSSPSVTLFTSDLEWNVRSDDSGSPGAIGTISLNTSGSPQDFEVKIANGAGAGATSVAVIDLTDTTGGYSLIESGSQISGNLGTMTVVKDSGGSGGSADGFTVSGNVTGNVTLPKGKGFTITGKYGATGSGQDTLTIGDITDGDVTIGSIEDALINVTGTISGSASNSLGRLQIKTTAADDSDINIDTMGSYAQLRIGYDSGGLATVDASIWVSSSLPATSKIDLSNAEMVDLGIVLFDGSYLDLAGEIHVAEWNGTLGVDDITGILRFNKLESGYVAVFGDVESGGLIDVNDDVTGAFLEIKGGLVGDITIDDDVTGGEIEVEGGTSGDLTITDAMTSGTLDLQGSLTGVVSIGGAASGGTINANVGSAGDVILLGASGGTLNLTGTMAGTVDITGTVSGTINAVDLDGLLLLRGDVSGDVIVTNDVDGALDLDSDLLSAGSIEIAGRLVGGIDIDGLDHGLIQIGKDTGENSVIHIHDGFEDAGRIVINESEGAFDADGVIFVVDVADPNTIPTPPLPNVIYDGCIQILEGSGGGDLNGSVQVWGCHATLRRIALCVGGDINGTVNIYQDECSTQCLGYACITPCP